MRDRRQPVRLATAVVSAAVVALLSAGSWASGDAPAASSAGEWSGVSRVVAMGDVHGNHAKVVRLLTAAELIDGDQRWIGGADHLVVAGDFLDRGLDDRPMMDLLRRLENESVAAGGRVHVLLGNHEVMNLMWDLRYVNPSSYRHFAPEESKADRRDAAGRYAQLVARDWGSESFRKFNRSFPAGFFARVAGLAPGGEYGDWLMQLPTVVKINGVVYTHGGLSEQFAALGVDGINRRVTERIVQYLEARQVLEQEGVVAPVMNVLQVAEAAERATRRQRGARGEAVREAAESLLAAAKDPILLGQGPLWYRGSAMQDERLERDIIDATLELLDAEAMVVAHSPTSTNRITSRFNGRLFRIDYDINGSETTLALVAEHGETLVLDAETRSTTQPQPEFPLGQLGASRNAPLSDQEMREFLRSSPAIAARPLGKGSTRPQLVVLQRNSDVRRAIFKTVQDVAGIDRYQHEVAAYRLDRALGLGMVPVTVLRDFDGQSGSLQAWVDGALDQETAAGYNLDFFSSDSKLSQLGKARVFDALIGNDARKPADILALVREGTVLLIDHSKAFSTSPDLPDGLGGLPPLPASLTKALAGLDRKAVSAELGELISAAQIEALLTRRDKILARLEGADPASS